MTSPTIRAPHWLTTVSGWIIKPLQLAKEVLVWTAAHVKSIGRPSKDLTDKREEKQRRKSLWKK